MKMINFPDFRSFDERLTWRLRQYRLSFETLQVSSLLQKTYVEAFSGESNVKFSTANNSQ